MQLKTVTISIIIQKVISLIETILTTLRRLYNDFTQSHANNMSKNDFLSMISSTSSKEDKLSNINKKEELEDKKRRLKAFETNFSNKIIVSDSSSVSSLDSFELEFEDVFCDKNRASSNTMKSQKKTR